MQIIGSSCINVVDYDQKLKDHLKLFNDDEQTLISTYIGAASRYIENYMGYPVLSDRLIVYVYGHNYSVMLPKNTIAVSTIYERQINRQWQELTPENEFIDEYAAHQVFFSDNIKTGYEYKIEVIACPVVTNIMREAAYLLIAEFYENRESLQKNVNVFNSQVNLLLDMEKITL